MESKRVVSKARAEQFASEAGGLLCETSAKENWGVNELFTRVSRMIAILYGYSVLRLLLRVTISSRESRMQYNSVTNVA